jgi:hypothetical protein
MFGAMTATPPQRSHFSLCEGGRFHAGLVRLGLAGHARGRLVLGAAILALGWLPLVVLTGLAGTATAGVSLPLLRDLGPWVRFFVVVPLLIAAEPFADRTLGVMVDALRAAPVPEAHRARFEQLVARAQSRATSDTAELVILVLALAVPHLVAQAAPHGDAVSTWFAAPEALGLDLSAAGRWYAWASLPLVQFLFLRWGWRIVAWGLLLWGVARLPLAVRPAHPDRAGGIGFLALAPSAFVPVFVALSALGAVAVASQIRFGGRTLTDVRVEVIALVVLEAAVLLVPQLFFVPMLAKARKRALLAYAAAGTAMARRFDAEWTEASGADRGGLLESPHSSAMIDFAGTYGLVEAMRPAGISLREVVRIVIPLAVPFLPLLLFQYSVKEILQGVLQMVR